MKLFGFFLIFAILCMLAIHNVEAQVTAGPATAAPVTTAAPAVPTVAPATTVAPVTTPTTAPPTVTPTGGKKKKVTVKNFRFKVVRKIKNNKRPASG